MATTLPPINVGDPVTADALDDGFGVDPDAASVFSSTAASPLTSTVSVDSLLISLASFPFRAGFAYEISWFFRYQVNGATAAGNAYPKIKRASATGTVIHDPGSTGTSAANFSSSTGACVVKCTVGDTTQTIVLTAAFTATSSGTSLDIEAGSTARTRLHIRKIGLAAAFTDALEIPIA